VNATNEAGAKPANTKSLLAFSWFEVIAGAFWLFVVLPEKFSMPIWCKLLILICLVAIASLLPKDLRLRAGIFFVVIYPGFFLICRALALVGVIVEWIENITGLGRRRFERCREAAIAGDMKAQSQLGLHYENGEYDLPKDNAEAVKWYRKAAEQDYRPAQFNLGVCLQKGKGVEQNIVEAYRWFTLSRRPGGPGSGHFMIDMSHAKLKELEGQLTEQQIAEAWASAETVSNDPLAQWTLGRSHASGKADGEPDFAEAVKWYRKAAEQNYLLAQIDLGVCLALGLGVEENLVEGYMWVYLAMTGGGPQEANDAAAQKLKELKVLMTEQQIAEALAMADKREIGPRYLKRSKRS
jgi:TPR repeat protein